MADVLSEVRGAALWITLNRPDQGNTVTDDMARELTRLLTQAGDQAKFVVLTGAGNDFCIGRGSTSSGAGPVEALQRKRGSDVVFDCYGSVRACSVPVVGLVRGRAHGFGCSLAGLCDITIAEAGATFRIPEMTHNTMPTMVMSSLIDRVPAKAIGYLTYTAVTISAERALTFGIVSNVVAAEMLDGEIGTVCDALTHAPRPALEGIKEYLRAAREMSVRGAVDYARNIHATINSSSEMRK